jgi:prophage tail gpP-like protein
MADDDIALIVNGRRYSGWESVRVTRSLESLAGSFALGVSDRWGSEDLAWPIMEEDECLVVIGDDGGNDVVIDGYVDRRSLSLTDTSRSLSYSGRDRAASLVDCSATAQGASVSAQSASAAGDIDPTRHTAASTKWTYTNIDIVQFVRALAAPFGVGVSVQPGLVPAKASKLIVHPGETAFEALKRAAEGAQVLVVSNASGGLVVTRVGAQRASALIEGFNVKTASVEYDGTDRFHRYLITTQIPGTDEASGEATNVQAEATDLGVRRTERTILIRPDKGYSTADARRRADWEARIRAARAERVTITVQGWRQPGVGGRLWMPNALALVSVPAIGINGDMLISQVEFSIGEGGGRITQINLVRPDAFSPEPQATVSGEGAWKELAGGV